MERLTKTKFKINARDLEPFENCDKPCVGACVNCVEFSKAHEKLAHYEDLEENGLLLKLPCRIGDEVFIPRENDIHKAIIDGIHVYKSDISFECSYECDFECEGCYFSSPYTNYEAGDGGCNGEYGEGSIDIKDIGKTVFLTKEDAEKALKEMEVRKSERN